MITLSAGALADVAVGMGAFQKPTEFHGLLDALCILKPRVILEIGIGKGGTSWAFSKLDSLELLIAIDLPGGPWGGQDGEMSASSFRYIKEGTKADVHLILGNSMNSGCLEKVNELLGDREIDFLFIDGDHSYAGVKTDFLTYSPLVRAGGLVAFHDVVAHPPETGCEVEKFWAELKATFPEKKMMEMVDENGGQWGGIGAIRW